jgi:hypothetical protein
MAFQCSKLAALEEASAVVTETKVCDAQWCQKAHGGEPWASPVPSIPLIYGQKREPTSGLEPLACSLRVIGQELQEFAEACKSGISRRFSLLRFALCCTVLRSRWCQSGINGTLASA